MKKKLVAIALATVTTATSWAEQTFTFTAIPDENSARLEERFGGVAKYLESKLGVTVKYVPVKSYSASVTAFKNNHVQLAWFGGLSGVKARAAVKGSNAIAQGAEDVQFKSYIIAHTSTGLEAGTELTGAVKGKTFTFGSKGSTSGRLMPEFYLRKTFNIAPEKIFSKVGFSGDHSKTIALVQSGAYLLGAVNYSVWDREVAEGKIDTSKVKVIWTTPTYPDYNWTIRGDVDKTWGAGFGQKVTDALLSLKDPKLLDSFPRSKFIPVTNEAYQPIVDTAQQLGIIRK